MESTLEPPRGVTLTNLVEELGGEVLGDGGVLVEGVAAPEDAGPTDLCPLLHPAFLARCRESDAGAFLTTPSLARRAGDRPSWVHDAPRLVLATLLERFAPEPIVEAGRHPSAIIDDGATVEPSARIDALVVIESGAFVGSRTWVGARTIVGRGVSIGDDCRIAPGVVLVGPATLGDRVRVGPGAVIGSDGFGFLPTGGTPRRVPQRGRVAIEDDVDLGALTVIDKATLGVTRVRRGAKLDNLVQVGHNVDVGSGAIVAAQTGLAGSVRIGDAALLGGQVGVADHLEIGPQARLAAKSGVVSDVQRGETVAGYPAVPHRTWLRIWGTLLRAAGRRGDKRR